MTRRRLGKVKQEEMAGDKPTVRIGKKGPTAFLVKEISKQLDRREVVKVKVLKTALVNGEVEEIAKRIADVTQSKIVQLRGHTFILYKAKKS